MRVPVTVGFYDNIEYEMCQVEYNCIGCRLRLGIAFYNEAKILFFFMEQSECHISS